ncbi:N-acetyl sugar amidotransferase, partial [Vibrio ponticus]
VLIDQVGWKDYGVKHGESKFTKFFQNYYLPKKFGYDKRRAHLSSLILAGELSRSEALLEIKRPLYQSEHEINLDIEYIAKKLDMDLEELNLLCLPSATDTSSYPTEEKLVNVGRRIKRALKL